MGSKGDSNAEAPVEKPLIAKKPYQFLHVGVLREYLALEFEMSTPFPLDQERIYDDFGALWVRTSPALVHFCIACSTVLEACKG